MNKGLLCLLAVVGLSPVLVRSQSFEEIYARALESYDNGSYAEAETQFKAALSFGARTDRVHFYLGMCAAFQGRLDEAERALSTAVRINPSLQEGHVELGGLYFKQRRPSESVRALKTALRLDPEDAYAHDLLGTVYFVMGSQDRALDEWNRVDKPVLGKVLASADGGVDRRVLTRELCFRPGRLIRNSQVKESLKRLDKVDCATGVAFTISPSPDHPDRADVVVSGRGLRGFGPSLAAVVAAGLRDIVHRTAYLDYRDLFHRGFNLYAIYRWDTYQRKAGLSLRLPRLLGTPCYYRLSYMDENDRWFFEAPDAAEEDLEFTLSQREWRVDVDAILGHRLGLSHHIRFKRTSRLGLSGVEDIEPGTRLVWGGALAAGPFELADAGLTVDLDLRYDVGGPQSEELPKFFKTALSARFVKSWGAGPAAEAAGSMSARLTWGRSSAATPFDEYFIMGVGPDVEHELRAYRTTEGRKLGRGPVAREFVLLNVDWLRRVARFPFIKLDGGLFLDAGQVLDDNPFNPEALSPLLADFGARLVVRALGVAFEMSYAHSFRGGRKTFYISSTLD